MGVLTIEGFWIERLPVGADRGDLLTPGWSRPSQGSRAFTEAPLNLSLLSREEDLEKANIILVSAPGAVGKSTLARQIAARTGAIYVDLAEAAPVGADALVGGLVKAKLYQEWEANSIALLLDGLDEARLKVTQTAFDVFVDNTAEISRKRSIPTVMFGRTGAIEEVWLRLQEARCPVVVLEIGYYDVGSALKFAEAWLYDVGKQAPAQQPVLRALLERLSEQTEADGRRFAGYAPVIQAVAMRVAEEKNLAALLSSVQKGEQPVTLLSIADAIIERERSKLDKLPFQDTSLKGILYNRDEQLARLVSKVLGTPLGDVKLPSMKPQDAIIYDQALSSWADDHAFLEPGRNMASTAVFDAVIMIAALSNSATSDQAIVRQLARGGAANPFLALLHPALGIERGGHLVPEQIGLLYASVRAGLSLGEVASLEVEDSNDADDEELTATVAITIRRRDEERPTSMNFTTTQLGVLKLGAHIEDVGVDLSYATVEIGSRQEATLISPIVIKCAKLVFTASKLVIEPAAASQLGAVALEAEECVSSIEAVPSVRKEVQLTVAWPDAQAYPWTSFIASYSLTEDSGLEEGLRRLRRFIVSFRSHSRGRLARYRAKIEGKRMIKGSGERILNLLVKDHVLSLEGAMYFLDPDQLSSQLNLSYVKATANDFDQKAIEFVKRALQ